VEATATNESQQDYVAYRVDRGCDNTLAKNLLTNQYRDRVKSSFRARTARRRFPKMNAPV